jgi:hypothetical protein
LLSLLVYRNYDAAAERRNIMKWITRANVKVDRVACPWLIRTFIDPEAEFLFAPVEQVEGVARKTGAIPYDTAGTELGHHGEECSFDAIVKKYGIKDEAVGRVALIVRGADTRRPDLTPQSPGLEAIAEGFKRLALPRATTIMKPSAGSGISMMLFISIAAAIPKNCDGIGRLTLQGQKFDQYLEFRNSAALSSCTCSMSHERN